MINDMIMKLHENLAEEIEGIRHYCEMADTAKMAGYPQLAMYLKQMAKDEFTHAWFIFETGKKHGIDTSPECYRKLMEYKEMIKW